MKRDETMQNMNYYYDFSGQKFEYPLSLSINQFDRQVFSRQSSLEISYVLKGVLRHRLILNFKGRANGITTDYIIEKIIQKIKTP